MLTDKKLFTSHKNHSKCRGISFEFTFEEWIKWWENALGTEWRILRGKNKGKYVMARIGDVGSYSSNNVECMLHEQNCKDRRENKTAAKGENIGTSKLTKELVLEIFASSEEWDVLSKQYAVSYSQIKRIKNKINWQDLLEDEQILFSGRKKRRDGTGTYPGVSWNKNADKWQAAVQIKGKRKYLGIYETEEEAIAVVERNK